MWGGQGQLLRLFSAADEWRVAAVLCAVEFLPCCSPMLAQQRLCVGGLELVLGWGAQHRSGCVSPPPVQEAAARAEEAARLHQEFSQMLRRVLDGHMDSSSFEDSCRALLGTNSYVLFTLDKLIQKFIKHMAVRVCQHIGCRGGAIATQAQVCVLGRGRTGWTHGSTCSAASAGYQGDLRKSGVWLKVSNPVIAHIGG